MSPPHTHHTLHPKLIPYILYAPCTVDAYGQSLRQAYNRTTIDAANYTELKYLGYFSNNGAAYYYNTYT